MRKYYLYVETFPCLACMVFLSDSPRWSESSYYELLRVLEAPSFAAACRLCPEHRTFVPHEKVFQMIEEFKNAV